MMDNYLKNQKMHLHMHIKTCRFANNRPLLRAKVSGAIREGNRANLTLSLSFSTARLISVYYLGAANSI